MKNVIAVLVAIIFIVSFSFFQVAHTGAPLVDFSAAGGFGGHGVILRIDDGMREWEIDPQLQKLARERHFGSIHLPAIELRNVGIQVRKGVLKTKGRLSMLLWVHLSQRGPARIYRAENISGTGTLGVYQFGTGS